MYFKNKLLFKNKHGDEKMKVIEKITSICKLSISILIIILLIQLVYDYSDGMIEIDIDLSQKGYWYINKK